MIKLPPGSYHPLVKDMDKAILKEIFPKSHFFICGGRALSYYFNKITKTQDIDLFFTSEKEFETAHSEILEYIDKNYGKNVGNTKADSKWAVTYFLKTEGGDAFAIQLIKKIYQSCDDIFDAFDMDHCKIAYEYSYGLVGIHRFGKGFHKSIRTNEIAINRVHPRSLQRVKKAMEQGFVLSENSLKMLQTFTEKFDETLKEDGTEYEYI